MKNLAALSLNKVKRAAAAIFRKLVGMMLFFTANLTVLLQKNTRFFPLLLLSSLYLNSMRPNFSFLSAASNAILKSGGPLEWKMRLVKDVRLLLPLIEAMKIVRLTSLLPDMPRLSSPKPRLKNGRWLTLLFPKSTLNLCTLSFVLLLAPLPHLPPFLTFPTVLLPGSWLRSPPTTRDPTFLFLSQKPCVAEPEATFPSSAEPRALSSLILLLSLISR